MTTRKKYRTRPSLIETSQRFQELQVQRKTIEDKIIRT